MSIRPPRVGIIVDHPKRDLAGCILLARELACRGMDCFLVPQYEQGADVALLGLDMLIINYARPVNLPLVRAYASMGIAVYVLDTEGGILADDGPSTPEKLAGYVRSSGYSSLLAGYFFWGRVLRDAFVQDGAMESCRLHLTGCPRFDFAAPCLRPLRRRRRSGHVLVNTNYPAVNARFTGGDDRQALISVGYPPDYVDILLRDTRRIMAGMIETVQKLAGHSPHQTFVLRPHPFENEQIYRQVFASLPNVEIDGSGNVIDALDGAKALLHLNCGTAIEAIMLGVVPYSLEFLNTPHMSGHASLPSRASRPVHGYDELVALLDGEPHGFDFEEQHRRYVEPYFHLNDGKAAHRVADILAFEARNLVSSRRKPSIRRSLLATRARPAPGQIAQSLLANVAGSLASSQFRSLFQANRNEKAVRLEEVAAYMGLMARHDGASLCFARARHPVTRAPLASVRIHAGPRKAAFQ